ncbi:MAG: sulfate reduction electron transfer complex DsrMKJOP subunit DsrO, partial [Burkholderiales bacterium]
ALGRRRFLKLASTGLAAGAFGVLLSDRILEVVPFVEEDLRLVSPERRQWVMLIDLAKCDGCGHCTLGCNREHFVPEGQEWIKVFKVEDDLGGQYFLPRPCMQCENAPCVKVCPVGATYRREDGVILIDHNRCIGCRYCIAACPYNARSFNWSEPTHTPEELAHVYSPEAPWPHRRGTVEKCMFCAHRAKEGKLPACVEACTAQMGDGAIYFGDLREDAVSNGVETIPLAKTLRERGGFRFKEELGTHPRVWYLPARRN